MTISEALGLRHLAFRVDCVEQLKAELEAMGIPCEPVRMDEFSNRKFTFFKDPDGLPLELHEQGAVLDKIIIKRGKTSKVHCLMS